MEDGIGQRLLIIFALIVANGFFAMTEMAIVSSRKARLESQAEEGHKAARVALNLASNPNNMLSTVQIGITVISIVTGLYGGQTLSAPLAEYIEKNMPFMAAYAASISPFIIVTTITFLSLIVGELVPKRIALNNPEKIAMIVARPMQLFSIISRPFVLLLSVSSDAIIRVLDIKSNEETPVTEDEIKVMLNRGAAMGAFEMEEPELVDNIFRLSDMNVGDVMTPRTQLQWLDMDAEDQELRQTIQEADHFRLPVGRDSLDELIGVVNVSDIFKTFISTDKTISLKDLIRQNINEPLVVPETITLVKLLTLFKTEGYHEAIVLDEFGGVSGFVTLHDILEEIVGLIPTNEDERQEEQNRIIVRSENSWYLDGLLNITEFKEHFELLEMLPGEEDDLYKTIGGFVTYCIGRIPREGDVVKIDEFSLEVCDMDNVRVDKVILTKEMTL